MRAPFFSLVTATPQKGDRPVNSRSRKRFSDSVPNAIAGLLLACSANTWAFDIYAVTTSGILARFDNATPSTLDLVQSITGLGVGESVIGIDIRPADLKLYALTRDLNNNGRLYTIDRATSAATPIGTLAADPTDLSSPYTTLSGAYFGMNFNPVVDRLRLVGDNGMNMRVNPNMALVLTDNALNPGSPNVVGVAYINSFAGATSTTLYDIDSASDTLHLQNPPNNGTLTTVGALGVDTSGIVGFDITTIDATDFAYATLSVGGTVGLYSINLSSGAATLVGDVGGNLAAISIAIEPDRIFQNGFN